MGRLRNTAGLFAVAGGLWLTGGAADGQELPPWSTAPTGWTPLRTPWGAPDLTGIWSSKHSTPLERPEEYVGREFLTDDEIAALDADRARAEAGDATAGRDVRASAGTPADVEGAYNNIFSTNLGTRYSRTKRTAMIIDPPDGRLPPFTPEAERSRQASEGLRAQAREDRERAGVPYFVDLRYRYDNPEDTGILERCQGVRIPCTGGICGFSRMVQGPDSVTIYHEQSSGGGGYRLIPLDGRPHPRPTSANGSGTRWAAGRATPSWWTLPTSPARRRIWGPPRTCTSSNASRALLPDLVQYRITVEDETVWTGPWTMELALVLQDNARNQIGETGCHEGNYSMTSMLAGAAWKRPAACASSPWQKAPLHSTGHASRLSCVVPRSHMLNMLPRHALSAGRLTGLGATRGFTTGCQPSCAGGPYREIGMLNVARKRCPPCTAVQGDGSALPFRGDKPL